MSRGDPLLEVTDLVAHFPGFAELLAAGGCRFDDCRHDAEPDCAIKAAVSEGRLAEARLQRYLELLTEVAESVNKFG